jgi:hypothetical protein
LRRSRTSRHCGEVARTVHRWPRGDTRDGGSNDPHQSPECGVAVPCEPARKLRYHGNESDESDPDDQTTLVQAEKITDHVSRIVFPRFRWTVATGVRSTRTRTGTYRRISDFASGWPQTRVLAVFPTSRRGSGYHSDTPTAATFESSLSNRFELCSGRRSDDSLIRSQRRRSSTEPE